MLEVTFTGWAATVGLIAALFLLDLFVTRPGHAHTVGFREAVVGSCSTSALRWPSGWSSG